MNFVSFTSRPQLTTLAGQCLSAIRNAQEPEGREKSKVLKSLVEEHLCNVAFSEGRKTVMDNLDSLVNNLKGKESATASKIQSLATSFLTDLSFSDLSPADMKEKIKLLKAPLLCFTGSPANKLNKRDFEDILVDCTKFCLLDGGRSQAKVYVVETGRGKCVVRSSAGLFGPEEIYQENAIAQKMSDEGIAPRVINSKPEEKVLALDFIETVSFFGFSRKTFAHIPDFEKRVMQLIRGVHKVGPFEHASSDGKNRPIGKRIASDNIKRVWQAVQESNLLGKDDQETLGRIANIPYPSVEGEFTLIHGDLQPPNILLDKDDRLWLIDWELSGLGHPFYDVACFANFLDKSSDGGNLLLSFYLGGPLLSQEEELLQQLKLISLGNYAALSLTVCINMINAMKVDPKIPAEDEQPLDSLLEVYRALDDKKFELSCRNFYRLALTYLRTAKKYLDPGVRRVDTS